jgi:glutathione S-transferase
MPTLKLTYFDVDGGRAEAARLAMALGNVPFEDDRFTFSEFQQRKQDTPFAAFPVLEVDGVHLAQCNGINRYVGKLAGLYPDDPLQAAFCDEAMDAVEDIAVRVQPTLVIRDEEEKRRARQVLVDGPIPHYLRALEGRLIARGGEWFADGRLTVADLKVFVWMRDVTNLDHVPADLPDRVAPKLVEHFERVKTHPGVKTYYDARAIA